MVVGQSATCLPTFCHVYVIPQTLSPQSRLTVAMCSAWGPTYRSVVRRAQGHGVAASYGLRQWVGQERRHASAHFSVDCPIGRLPNLANGGSLHALRRLGLADALGIGREALVRLHAHIFVDHVVALAQNLP